MWSHDIEIIMSVISIIIFLVIVGIAIYYIVNLLIRKRMTEAFENPHQMTIDDSHYFLTTAVLPGKEDIVNLKETNPSHTKYIYVDQSAQRMEDPSNVVTQRQSSLNQQNLVCFDQTAWRSWLDSINHICMINRN